MDDLKDRLREIRGDVSYQEFADRLTRAGYKCSQPTVIAYEKKKSDEADRYTAKIPSDYLVAICNLRWSSIGGKPNPSWLLFGSSPKVVLGPEESAVTLDAVRLLLSTARMAQTAKGARATSGEELLRIVGEQLATPTPAATEDRVARAREVLNEEAGGGEGERDAG